MQQTVAALQTDVQTVVQTQGADGARVQDVAVGLNTAGMAHAQLHSEVAGLRG